MPEGSTAAPRLADSLSVQPARGWRRARGWVVALAALAGAGALGLDANLTTDSVRDLLNAQECVQGLTCEEKGTSASVGNLTHGTIWTRFLIGVDLLGLTPYQQMLLLFAGFALATGLVYVYAARYTRDAVGLWTAVIFAVLVGAAGFPEFSNEYLGLLPQALYYYGMARIIEGGGLRWTLLAGLSLFCCTDAHMSFLALTPILLWAAASAPVNPAQHLVLAAVAFIGPAGTLSAQQYLQNFRSDPRLPAAIVGTALGLAVTGALIRSWWLQRAVRTRVAVAAIVSVVWFLGVGLAAQAARGWSLKLQYVVPVAAPLAFLLATCLFVGLDRVALLLSRLHSAGAARLRAGWQRAPVGGRVVAVLAGALGTAMTAVWLVHTVGYRRQHYLYVVPAVAPFGVLAAALPAEALKRASRAGYRAVLYLLFACFFVEVWGAPFADHWAWATEPKHLQVRSLSIIGEYLKSQGWSYPEARQAEGTGLWQTNSKLAFLRLILPPAQANATLANQVPRIVLTDDRELLAQGFPGWQALDLGRGWRAEISPITPWIRPGEAHLTFERGGQEVAAYELHDAWSPPRPPAAASGHYEDLPFMLTYLRPDLALSKFDGATVRFELNLEPSGDEEARDIWIVNYADDDGMMRSPVGWLIESIDGLDATIDPSRLFATVRRGTGARGKIRIVHPAKNPTARFYDTPPQFFESRPQETTIRSAVSRSNWVFSKREKMKMTIVPGPPG